MMRLTVAEVEQLDPYLLMAVLGKRYVHPGGRRATEQLLEWADIGASHEVLDIGCGVGTTAIEVARRTGARVVAADISPVMVDRARRNVAAAGMEEQVRVEVADICDLPYPDGAFDRVIAEAVTMFVERPRAAAELARVCGSGGRVLATEFFWRKPPTREAREIFLGEVCPGLHFDSVDDWVRLYAGSGLESIRTATGPFEMLTPRGFVDDEGVGGSVRFGLRGLSRWVYLRRLRWLLPRMARSVGFLGYLAVVGAKPGAESQTAM
jgi:SAM-dependent methyltransferase